MRQGHCKVARAYIHVSRSARPVARSRKQARPLEPPPADSTGSRSLINVRQVSPTETFLWDGQDLRRRIDYAALGLGPVHQPRNEIELELRRSIFEEITLEELKTTIILNAKHARWRRDAELRQVRRPHPAQLHL